MHAELFIFECGAEDRCGWDNQQYGDGAVEPST